MCYHDGAQHVASRIFGTTFRDIQLSPRIYNLQKLIEGNERDTRNQSSRLDMIFSSRENHLLDRKLYVYLSNFYSLQDVFQRS